MPACLPWRLNNLAPQRVTRLREEGIDWKHIPQLTGDSKVPCRKEPVNGRLDTRRRYLDALNSHHLRWDDPVVIGQETDVEISFTSAAFGHLSFDGKLAWARIGRHLEQIEFINGHT